MNYDFQLKPFIIVNFISIFFKENSPRILRFFAKQARKPNGLFGKYVAGKAFNKGNQALHEFGLSLMDIKSYDHVLEIGFGNGLQLFEMASKEKSASFYGIDFSEDMVSQAKKLNKNFINEGRMELRQASVENIPYEENKFDSIYTANTVYFWPNHDANLKEVSRVLKPGGKLYLGFRTKEQMEKIPFTRYGFTMFSEGRMEDFLRKGGFRDIEIKQRKDKPIDSYIAVAVK